MMTTPLLRAAAALLALGALLSGCAQVDDLWKVDGMTPGQFLEDDKRRRAEGRPTLRQEKEQQARQGQSAAGGTVGGAILTSDATAVGGSRVCRTVQASGKADVDTAYIRAMEAFNFQTVSEDDRSHMYDSDIKHDKTPGVMYDLWDVVVMSGPTTGKRIIVNMGLRLSKNGTGSALSSKYCLSPADSGSADFIAQKIKALVR